MSGSQQLLLAAVQQALPDPYFEYTTLLLPGNGTNGAQNNTFLDSSTNAFSITRNGNTTQGTFSPFSQTGWGNYFDGNGDYLSAPSNAVFSMGTGDYTFETWLYKTTTLRANILAVGSGGLAVAVNTSGNIEVCRSGVAIDFTFTAGIVNNQWYHIAVTRSGTDLRVFLNGSLLGTQTSSTSYPQGVCYVGIDTGGVGDIFAGYLSNFRLVKGTALYTSSFTPSTTPLTNVSGTSILTCQSNRFVDNSSNAFAITRNGDVSVQAFSPFNPTAAWSAATNGGSGYFDGSGDYVSAPSDAAFSIGTGDYTFETWIYKTTTLRANILAVGSGGLAIAVNASGNIEVCRSGVAIDFTFTANIVNNVWYHIAVTRSGTSLRAFLNGTLLGTQTSSNSYPQGICYVGIDTGGVGDIFAGYMSSFRLVKGTAVYTSSFTAPTAPLSAISGTSILLNFTNAGIYDATSKNDLETVGNAQISTTQSKFGGSSMYFDGTGDGLLAPSTSRAIQFGTGAYTVEFWLYMNSVSGNQGLVTSAGGSGTGPIMALRSGKLTSGIFGSADTITSTTTLSTGQWYHVAYVRDSTGSNATRIYLNGVLDATGTISTDFSTAQGVAVGYTPTASEPANCYIDDLRITRGVARYTTGFTPPTTAFPVF